MAIEQVGRVALRGKFGVGGIDDDQPAIPPDQAGREIDRDGRLSDATLLIDQANYHSSSPS